MAALAALGLLVPVFLGQVESQVKVPQLLAGLAELVLLLLHLPHVEEVMWNACLALLLLLLPLVAPLVAALAALGLGLLVPVCLGYDVK